MALPCEPFSLVGYPGAPILGVGAVLIIGYSVVSYIVFYVEQNIGFSALKKAEWDLRGDFD